MPHPRACNTNARLMVQSKHSSTAQLHIISGILNAKTCVLATGSVHRTQRRLGAKVCPLWTQRERAIFQNMVWMGTVRKSMDSGSPSDDILVCLTGTTQLDLELKKKLVIFSKWKNNIIIFQGNNYNSAVNRSKILVLIYKETNSFRTREQKKMPSSCQTDVIR